MSSAQTMKIFNIISKIEQILEESPKSKFGTTNRRTVDVDMLYDILGDLKVTIPEDIRRAGGVIAEGENILREANENADEIIDAAQHEAEELTRQAQDAAEKVYNQAVEEYNALVSESSVYQEAQARAAQMTAEAEEQSGTMMNSAKQYADDILADVQRYLYQYTRILNENREQLDAPVLEEPPVAAPRRERGARESASQAPVQQASRRQAASESYDEPRARQSAEPRYRASEDDYLSDESARRSVSQPPRQAVPRARDIEDSYAGATEPVPRQRQSQYVPERGRDDDYQAGETAKKRGWFKRMLEGDGEDDYEDWDEDVAAEKPKKKKAKLFEFVTVEEDDDDYDEDYDYE